jgi:hypothetical protein
VGSDSLELFEEGDLMLDWRELDFFRSRGGLSTADSLESAIAYDFELVRCSSALVDYILTFEDRKQRALASLTRTPYLARWADGLKAGHVPENIESLRLEPIIPTACLIASWFPAPWLSGSCKEQKQIVHLLKKAYASVRPLQLRPYPVDPKYLQKIESARSETFQLWVIGIDEQEPFKTTAARLIQARKELRHKPTPRSKHHRADRGSAAALGRLTCYRLSLMPRAQRAEWIEKIPMFSRLKNVDTKLTQGAASVRSYFRKRNYAMLL